jgi:hypothetical protein
MVMATRAPIPWQVPWNKAQIFHFRAGDVIERGDLEADLEAHNAAEVFGFDWQAAFAGGIAALLADDPAGAATLIGIYQAEQGLNKGETLASEEQAGLDQARELLKEHWPAYRALVLREAKRKQLAPTLAFQRYCVGWEGEDLPVCEIGPDGRVKLDVLRKLGSLVLKAGGAFAYGLQYGSAHAKNLEAPSPSDEAPPPSTSDTRRAGGKSAAKSGSATRKKRSRRGSSRSSISGSIAGG